MVKKQKYKVTEQGCYKNSEADGGQQSEVNV